MTTPAPVLEGRTVLAVATTVLAWASAIVAIRGVGEDLSPGALALGRLLIGATVLGALLVGRGWVAPGRKMQLEFELTGTKGTLFFTQERFNELQLYAAGQGRAREGFRTIVAGPDTPPYGAFCPAPGHQLGFNDLKTIEVAALIDAIAAGGEASPDFAEAYEIQRTVAAALLSSRERRWVRTDEL